METVTISLTLLLAVVVSGWIGRLSPVPAPLPLVQIVLGAVIASMAEFRVKLDPDIFFLLFLPPLLFLDGWRIPREGLLRDKETILALAFGLVIFTVIGLGFFIHTLIPSMPLPVAFALAGIVSPTDPVAVSAIAARIPIPKRLIHILDAESLLNDASGLVSMRFAVAAALAGTFALRDALLTFVWLVVGGVAIGVAVTWGVTAAKNWVTRRLGEEPASQILISLLIPFGAYLLAEECGCSGILAAVAAGIAMNRAEQSGRASALTRIRRTAVWHTIDFTAKGVIFVLLGEQLPTIIDGAAAVVQTAGHQHPAWLLVYVIAINFVLAALRFIWVWVSLRFMLFRAACRGLQLQKPSWRLIAVTVLAGVRGAVTLAGVLTFPFFMSDGSPFPARDLAIFLAAGVIVLSLVAASIGLPFLLKGLVLPPEPSHQAEEDTARVAASEAAIRAVEQAQRDLSAHGGGDLHAEAAAPIVEIYRRRIDGRSNTEQDAGRARKLEGIERKLWLVAVRAERAELYRLARTRGLTDELTRRLVREVDLIETRFTPG